MPEWVFYALFTNLGFSLATTLWAWTIVPEGTSWLGKLRMLAVYLFIVTINVVAITLGLVAG